MSEKPAAYKIAKPSIPANIAGNKVACLISGQAWIWVFSSNTGVDGM
jgi:hypothetical protein